MIDIRRWVLVEAWLALGLRVEWLPSYLESQELDKHWQQDDDSGARYVYDGDRTWRVRDESWRSRRPGFKTPKVPELGTDALAHELAHFLSASPEQREQRNFGLADDTDGSREAAALETEAVIDAIVAAATRIAESAMAGRRSR